MFTNLTDIRELNNYKKIMIIGCPGSGKSTLSKQLGEILNLEVIHLDKIYWKPFWVNLTKEEFDKKLEEILKLDSFIIDGNYHRTIKKRLEKSDLIIYLDYPTEICIQSYITRVKEKSIKEFITENCVEEIDEEFLQYISSYNEKYKESNYQKIYESNKKYVILNNREEKENLISLIKR